MGRTDIFKVAIIAQPRRFWPEVVPFASGAYRFPNGSCFIKQGFEGLLIGFGNDSGGIPQINQLDRVRYYA